MKYLILILLFTPLLEENCFGFPDSLKYYIEDVNSIDASDLIVRVIPWGELEGCMDSYDHGVEIKLLSDSTTLRKAQVSYGLSGGPIIISIYFRDTIPFYMSEITKHYHFDENKGEFDYDKPMITKEKKELYIYNWENNYCFNILNSKESETGPIQHPFSPHDYLYYVKLAYKYYQTE